MKDNRLFKVFATMALLLALAGNGFSAGVTVEPTLFDRELQRIKYQTTSYQLTNDRVLVSVATFPGEEDDSSEGLKRKSPGKAFLLSLAVPGLGQYYYGSRVKPFVFLATELLVWSYNIKYNNQGDDITDEFEAYNREHWSEDDYEQFLQWRYLVDDDDSLINVRGITHHLPSTRTQQYYEMTGKYDQFAWGWDDAVYESRRLIDYNANFPPPYLDEGIPYTARRFVYEQRRHDANVRYDRAKKLVVVSMMNRLISAFEAYFTTKSRNRNIPEAQSAFSRVNLSTGLKTSYSKQDTPYMKVTYIF